VVNLTHYCAYISTLLPRGLQGVSLAGLILGLASRLDAFSVYPCST